MMEKERIKLYKPRLIGISGVYRGAVIEFTEEIAVGSDARASHLIIERADISGKHCTISFDGSIRKYIVTDLSESGTYAADGGSIDWVAWKDILYKASSWEHPEHMVFNIAKIKPKLQRMMKYLPTKLGAGSFIRIGEKDDIFLLGETVVRTPMGY